MGAAKERKKEIEKTIRRREKFVRLCRKYTQLGEREILTVLKVRIFENKL